MSKINESHLTSYLNAVQNYLDANTAAINKFLESANSNQLEKKLIRVRILIKAREFSQALELVNSITATSTFYEGEKNLLLANIYGFSSKWSQALYHNTLALAAYSEITHRRGLFLTNYNLSADYGQLGLAEMSQFYLQQAQKFADAADYKSQVCRGLAWNEILKNSPAIAVALIQKGLEFINDLQDSEKSMLLAVAADIYFRAGELSRSLQILQNLQASKSLREKGRVAFEYKILSKMLSEKWPYSQLGPQPEAIEVDSEYQFKWNVVNSLIAGDLRKADDEWAQLVRRFPQVYGAGYQCLSPVEAQSIFMQFLNLIPKRTEVKVSESLSTLSKPELLIHILKFSAPRGIRKEEIIEKIWQQKYEYHMDAKLYKLVQRARLISQDQIIQSEGCYYLKRA